MRVVVLYRPNSESAQAVEAFAAEFSRRYRDKKLELMNVDTRDGSAVASLYDVLQYPAVLALTDDGQIIREWQTAHMPLISEVSYYAAA